MIALLFLVVVLIIHVHLPLQRNLMNPMLFLKKHTRIPMKNPMKIPMKNTMKIPMKIPMMIHTKGLMTTITGFFACILYSVVTLVTAKSLEISRSHI